MPISRSRNTQHKVYIPSAARPTHYILAKFSLTDEILEKYSDLIDMSSELPYQRFYQALSDLFCKINNESEIESGQFIANDKFPRIRFSPEKLTVQTEQQILFLYNPRNHYSQNSYINGAKRVENFTLVYLANGDDVRASAPKFHDTVRKIVTEFTQEIGVKESDIRFCDHQHLTYDLFAKDKGITGTQTHKLRTIKNRYIADGVTLPEKREVLTYAVVDIPINRRIKKLVEIDKSLPRPYQALYELVNEVVTESAKKQGLLEGAVVASPKMPIARNATEDNISETSELIKLGYNPFEPKNNFTFHCEGNRLVDAVKVIIVASIDHKTRNGYGKFLNTVELALRNTAEKLGYVYDKEEMMVRLHQHIGYDL